MGYSSSESEESETDYSMFKDLVLRQISKVHSAGSFSTFGHLESFTHPGIHVDEVGTVRIPLSSDDAQSLIRVSRQAPFGKGSQTLVDETVRKSWEIDGTKVSFLNKAWQGCVEGIIRTVAKDLGVPRGSCCVKAELYKMLLYEEGAMFKPHKDTEKTPGMFGTLVICLPSEHSGGAVRLTHGQEEKTFDTAGFSAFDLTYIAWYADVVHEIEPVQSGYRWVLIYNLINTSPGFPLSAARLDAQTLSLCQTLTEWQSLEDPPQFLCYALEYQYTGAGIKSAMMKSNDYNRVRFVADSCQKSGKFCVLLAKLQKVRTFANDEGGEEGADTRLLLNDIIDLEGFNFETNLRISKHNILQYRLYESRDPDAQHGGEYVGNQHEEIDQIYNDSAMIIVPKDNVTDFLLGSCPDSAIFEKLIARLVFYSKTRNKDSYSHDLLLQICERWSKRKYPNNNTNDAYLGPVAFVAVFISDEGIFRDAVHLMKNAFSGNVFSNLGKLYCFQEPAVPEKYLIQLFSKIPKLHTLHRCLQAFRIGFSKKKANRHDENQAQHLVNWVKNRVSEALESLPNAFPQDIAALINIINEYDDRMLDYFVKPFITRFLEDSEFVNALGVEILSFSQSSSPAKDLVDLVFPLALDAIFSHFELPKYSSSRKTTLPRCDYPYSSWSDCYGEEKKGQLDAGIVVSLYQHLFKSDRNKASELLVKIQLQTEGIAIAELDRFVIPLLKRLMDILDLDSSESSGFYQSILVTYISRTVQQEPEKPTDWSRPKDHECYRSNCTICPELREFLLDPAKESHSFVMPEDMRDSWHFEYAILNRCTRKTDETQKPRVTIVRKTLKRWEEEHRGWEKRASKAQATLKEFPEEKMKQCLAGKKDDIMDLRMVKTQNEGLEAEASKTSVDDNSHTQDNSCIPQKRSLDDS